MAIDGVDLFAGCGGGFLTVTLPDRIAECIDSALPARKGQRIVITREMFIELTTLENQRRSAMASEYYRPPPPLDPDTIDPGAVRIYGLPIRIDDAATAPYVEEIE